MFGLFKRNEKASSAEPQQPVRSHEAQARVDYLKSIAEDFGVQDAVCPSCQGDMPKFPKRKTKCKRCEKFVYPRKNPFTERYVLLSESDFALYEELSVLAKGWWDSWYKNQQELDAIRRQLAAEWGLDDYRKVPVSDAEWRRITNEANRCLQANNWLGYWGARQSGIRQLSRERKYKQALPLIYEFIYLTYSGGFMDRMYGPQLIMVDMAAPDVKALRAGYIDFMQTSALPQVFRKKPKAAFKEYLKERQKYYDRLKASNELDDHLEFIARAHARA